MITMKKRLALLLPLLIVALAGCSDDDSNPMGMSTETTRLRVVHASPDAPAVDVYAEGVSTPLLSNVAYGDVSAYLDVDPGTVNVQIRAAGSGSSGAVLYETGPLTLIEGASVTAVAAGLYGSSDSADAFRVLALGEDFADPAAGMARVRIVHAGADAPTVALDVNNDGSAEVIDFARFADTGADGVALPAGQSLQVGVWAGSPLARVTAFTTPALADGGEYFLIATGLLGDLPRDEKGFALLAADASGGIGLVRQNPTVYALHAGADAPAVDIWAGGAVVIANLDFGELSAPLQLPPDAYTLAFSATGTSDVAASATTPTLAAGERYLAVASGLLSDASFTLLPLAEGFDMGGDVRVRVLHASPGAPSVDVGVVAGGFSAVPELSDLAFGESSAATGVALGSGPVTLGVAATGETDPVATFDLDARSGGRYFAVAAGLLGDTERPFRLLLVDSAVGPWTVNDVPAN